MLEANKVKVNTKVLLDLQLVQFVSKRTVSDVKKAVIWSVGHIRPWFDQFTSFH